jgi:hypothetical protein
MTFQSEKQQPQQITFQQNVTNRQIPPAARATFGRNRTQERRIRLLLTRKGGDAETRGRRLEEICRVRMVCAKLWQRAIVC